MLSKLGGPSAISNGGNAPAGTLTLGTTNAQPVVFISNNTERIRIAADGTITFSGTPTTINSTVLDVADRVIHVNHSAGADDPAPTLITGIGVHRGAVAGVARDHAALLWDEANARWNFALNTAGDDSTIGADQAVRLGALTATGLVTIGLAGTEPTVTIGSFNATANWFIRTNHTSTTQVLDLSFNGAQGGSPVTAGVPVFRWTVNCPNTVDGVTAMDVNWRYTSGDGATAREPFFMLVDTTTHAPTIGIQGELTVLDKLGTTRHLQIPDGTGALTATLGEAGTSISFSSVEKINITAGATSLWQTSTGGLTVSAGAALALLGGTTAGLSSTNGRLTIDANGGLTKGILLQASSATILDIGDTTASTATLAAGASLAGAAGAGALSFGAMTGPTALPTGNLSWAGASTKVLSLVANGAGGDLTLTSNAGAVSITTGTTINISAGSTTNVDASTTLSLGVTNASTINIGREAATSTVTGAFGVRRTVSGFTSGMTLVRSTDSLWIWDSIDRTTTWQFGNAQQTNLDVHGTVRASVSTTTPSLDTDTGTLAIGSAATTRTWNVGNGNAVQTANLFNHATPANIINLGGAASSTIVGGKVSLGQGTVSQATSITTAVTVDASSGVITTQTANAGAGGSHSFTVNNARVTAASVVVAILGDYSGTFGTNGDPVVYVNAIASGSFQLQIGNSATVNALNGTFKIKFVVL